MSLLVDELVLTLLLCDVYIQLTSLQINLVSKFQPSLFNGWLGFLKVPSKYRDHSRSAVERQD